MPRRADIDSFYTSQHPEQSSLDWRAFYERAERLTEEVRRRYRHELDVAYGGHPRKVLDLYYPDAGQDPRPVLLFIHGGSFREGDPTLFGYLGKPFLDRGYIFGSIGYRLRPETYYPECASDIEAALIWLSKNLPHRGGDVDRIVLSGHSAGAMPAVHVGVRDDWQRAAGLGAVPAAIVPISGRYDLRGEQSDMLATPDDAPAASPVTFVSRRIPAVITYGTIERDVEKFASSAEALTEAMRRNGSPVELIPQEGMNHGETAHALGDERSSLFKAVEKLLIG